MDQTNETSMEQTSEKLKFLLNHWAEHNEEHKKSFVKWIEKAKSIGLDDAAVNLAKAVDAIDKATKYLKKGLKSVEDG